MVTTGMERFVRGASGVLCVPLLLFVSGAAHAQEPPVEEQKVSVDFNEDFEVRYWQVDDRLQDPSDVPVLNYVEQVNRFNAKANVGAWSFGVQVDEVALLANRYYLDDVLQIERPLLDPEINPTPFSATSDVYANLEKVQVRYEGDGATVNLGDVYAAFGRGASLNLNRNVDIDIDTSIQGAKVVARPGAWDLTAVVGQLNRQQVWQDNPNLNLKGDFRHMVGGLRAERFGLGPANIGAHGVVYNFVDAHGLGPGFEELGTAPDAVIGGLTTELMGVAGIDWYAEFDHYTYLDNNLSTFGDTGYAAYLSANAYVGKTTWMFEGKRYDNANAVNNRLAQELYQVAIAPTLEYERAVTEDSAAALGSNDIYGGRVRMDYTAKPGEFIPYASVAVFRDSDFEGPLAFHPVPETIVHPMVGVEYIKDDWAALLNAGVRNDIRDGTDRGADRQIHWDATLNFPLGGPLHGNLNWGAEQYSWGINDFQQEDYFETETALTVSYHSDVSFTWFTDYTTNPLVNSTGNLSDSLYAAGELQYKPSGAVTLKAFYGAYKAGIRCSGGQCRQMPGFSGARFSAVAAF